MYIDPILTEWSIVDIKVIMVEYKKNSLQKKNSLLISQLVYPFVINCVKISQTNL